MAMATFESVCEELIVPGMDQQLALNALVGLRGRHQEPWRGYHVFEHPLELFDLLHLYGQDVEDPLAVGWTYVFHDSVYDPLLPHGMSEERSAQLAESEIVTFGPKSLADRVSGLTRASFTHEVEPDDYDANFFMDSDLGILGAPPERYRQYVKGIGYEYLRNSEGVRYTPKEIQLGRAGILSDLVVRVDGEGLYRTDVFREHREEPAQRNVKDEIRALEKGTWIDEYLEEK